VAGELLEPGDVHALGDAARDHHLPDLYGSAQRSTLHFGRASSDTWRAPR
jgi:hypothetical protein